MEEKQRPKVGVGVIVFKGGKVLIGKRKGSHGEGKWAWPGGHLEFEESIADCCRREVMEEAGIEIENIRFLRLMNLVAYGKHYADIAMISDWKNGEAKVLEPEKCDGWEWRSLDDLPEPLFGTLPTALEAIKTGKNFFDSQKHD